ncbi:hypothetical protein [Myxococcus xanthus]|uniref:hypothetical protein n=1 Tax=Myxococcus xanthus TaxID=34 RepID=UPI001CEC3023|nr:hypothetical protein [Myxococcus xanthus]
MGCNAFFWGARAVELGHVDHVTSQCDETLTTLTLESTGARRTEVMQRLRSDLGMGLQEVKHFVAQLSWTCHPSRRSGQAWRLFVTRRGGPTHGSSGFRQGQRSR